MLDRIVRYEELGIFFSKCHFHHTPMNLLIVQQPQPTHFNCILPGAMAELVEHRYRLQEIVGLNRGRVKLMSYKIDTLSVPSQVLGIIRIGRGLVGSLSG